MICREEGTGEGEGGELASCREENVTQRQCSEVTSLSGAGLLYRR